MQPPRRKDAKVDGQKCIPGVDFKIVQSTIVQFAIIMKIQYKAVLDGLKEYHGSTMLGHLGDDDPWQTLIATILSARSRDETTEIVARDLFVHYPDCQSLAVAPVRK